MNIQLFEQNGWEVRTVIKNGNPWFIASDIAKALGYEKPNNAINNHCKKVSKFSYPDTGQRINIIPESDMYRLIIKSQLPEAEKFEIWVMEEVLPQIMRYGTYASKIPKTYADSLRLCADQAEQIEKQTKQLEEQKPKVSFANAIEGSESSLSMGAFAKTIGYGPNKLFEKLRDNGILMTGSRHNQPKQRYLDQGYFEVTESIINRTRGDQIIITTLVTGKGQLWISKKIGGWDK